MRKTIRQAFAVTFDYPVTFTRGMFRPANTVLVETLARSGERQPARVAVYVDEGVKNVVPEIVRCFEAHRARIELMSPPRVLPGGEGVKNVTSVAKGVVEELIDQRMDRQSFVLAVGGGALLDAVGFATALVHRGLRLVRAPTTVLAQNDAGVGVKNAVNFEGGKNLIGTFSPPFAVINDLDFLNSLPARAWTDGIAEAFKVAIIKDAVFLNALCDLAPALRARDAQAMEQLVVRCAELHLEHIRSSGDPFELGRARPLDFGHWSAHKLESLSDYQISHGRAVAIGIALDSAYAAAKGWLAEADFQKIYDGLTRAGFELWTDLLERRNAAKEWELIEGLRDFREHLGGELCVTMPRGLGQKFEVNEIDTDTIARSVSRLRHAHTTPAPTSSDLRP